MGDLGSSTSLPQVVPGAKKSDWLFSCTHLSRIKE